MMAEASNGNGSVPATPFLSLALTGLSALALLVWAALRGLGVVDFNPFFIWSDRPGTYVSVEPILGSHYFGDSQELIAAKRERGLTLYFGLASLIGLIPNLSPAIFTKVSLSACIIAIVSFGWRVRGERSAFLFITALPFLMWAFDRGQFLYIIAILSVSDLILRIRPNQPGGPGALAAQTALPYYLLASVKPQTSIVVIVVVLLYGSREKATRVSIGLFVLSVHVVDLAAIVNGNHALTKVNTQVWSSEQLANEASRNASVFSLFQSVSLPIGWVAVSCVGIAAVLYVLAVGNGQMLLVVICAVPLFLIPRSPLYGGLFIIPLLCLIALTEHANYQGWSRLDIPKWSVLLGTSSVWFVSPTFFGPTRPLSNVTLPLTACIIVAWSCWASSRLGVFSRDNEFGPSARRHAEHDSGSNHADLEIQD